MPVCASVACIMPTHLRFRRRSFLGLLFLFTLSTSALYFIYSAPGIGKSSQIDEFITKIIGDEDVVRLFVWAVRSCVTARLRKDVAMRLYSSPNL